MGNLESISEILRDKCQLDIKQLVVVGVSGGADSLCLLHVLHSIGYQVVVAHFDHGLRPESDLEAREVEAVAGNLSVPFISARGDVRKHARISGRSIEAAARHLRYSFLFDQARQYRAQAIAVGHTADDQVETVLMHLIRGAGLNGLKGMSYKTCLVVFDPAIPIVRPLLGVWRDEILAYCTSHSLRPQYDATNDSLDFQRNRIRHELIPTLETFNPRIRAAVWRMAQQLSADYEHLDQYVTAAWVATAGSRSSNFIAFDSQNLIAQSPVIQRHLIRRAIESLVPGADVTSAVLDRASAFILDLKKARMDLIHGLVLLKENQSVFVSRIEDDLPASEWLQMPMDSDSIPISIPESVILPNGWTFETQQDTSMGNSITGISTRLDPFHTWLDADMLPKEMELRSRRHGDRFHPLGLHGHTQKLSDLFVNVKLPARARRRWPLVCSGDRVIWVPGYRLCEEYKLNPDTQHSVRFSFTRRVISS